LGILAMTTCAALTLGIGLVYSQGILPSVSAAGIPIGGLSIEKAAAKLEADWNVLLLRDGDRTWTLNPALLGIILDGATTARQAYEQGRSAGSPVQAILGGVEVTPRVDIDMVIAAVTLDELSPRFEIPAVNAGVQVVNGQVAATSAQEGRQLDTVALIMRLDHGGVAAEVADGVIDLPMRRIAPAISDSTGMVALARDLLANPLQIEAYDPIDNQRAIWSVPPEQWSQWLTARPDPASPLGLALAVDDSALRTYLTRQEAALQGPQYFLVDEAATAIDNALASGSTRTSLRIYHHDTQHVVQAGETIISIAWNYGVPYPWIQQANPGAGDALSVGQSITIPSADHFFDFPVVPNKRVVVSISQQRVRVYENDQLKWDWIASTGINSSPTWPGVYQIISHVPNAYAANWNLWMPDFLGVYRPIPGQDFTNGFHGFPTRGGSQLLWTNNLGTRVTYGCILLSSDNAKLLYNWAEDGVVVEIQA
ncbi:MAG: L,D-transpeptidase family protein, partial [Anaerolineae bacterium]|nr:L,D-transpeptidase family protein [Anaerolineae bacterium]